MTMQAPALRANVSSDSALATVRAILFVSILLLAWITVKPFVSLADPKLASLEDNSDVLNQFAYVALAGCVITYFLIHEPWRARPLLRPAYLAMIAWIMATIVTSNYPGLSVKRFIFTVLAMVLAAALPLLATNFRRFCDLLAVSVLIVLVLCYTGLVFAPEFSIHQASDIVEPLLAGNWRGLFNHKNVAGPMMAIFVFIGVFIARARNVTVGCLIAIPAAVFLWFTQAKTATALLPVVFAMAWVLMRFRSNTLSALLVFGMLALLNLLTVGSVLLDPVAAFNKATMSDPTFTGRTDIWQFALDSIQERLWLGHGFGAFWETPVTFFQPMTEGSQVAYASHAHSAFLELALTIGIPGLVLAVIWTVFLPFGDMQRCKATGAHPALTMLFVQIWLFALYTCCFESLLFDRGNPNWFTMLVAMFGLRYLSVAQLNNNEETPRGAEAKT